MSGSACSRSQLGVSMMWASASCTIRPDTYGMGEQYCLPFDAVMAASNMPVAEVDIDLDVVRALLAEQMSDLADRPLSVLAHGWDTVVFRLGDDLTVRLPRRAVVAEHIRHEQR